MGGANTLKACNSVQFAVAYRVGSPGYSSPSAAVKAFVRSHQVKDRLPPGPWYGASLSVSGAAPASVSVTNGDVTLTVTRTRRGYLVTGGSYGPSESC